MSGPYSTPDSPGNDLRAIAPSGAVLDPRPKGLYFAENGTITIENADGTSAVDVPVFAGQTLRLRAHKLTAASGDVFGLY